MEILGDSGLVRSIDVVEVNRALGAPDRLAGSLVQGHDELVIAAIEMENEQVLIEKR